MADRKEKKVLRTAWRNWKTKRLGRRTDRWKELMREKEVIVIEARQKRVTAEAFEVSHDIPPQSQTHVLLAELENGHRSASSCELQRRLSRGDLFPSLGERNK